MKKINVLIVAILMIASFSLTAQVAITTDGSSANSSAMLDVKSTTKGLLPPVMTKTQMNDIAYPAFGLTVMCTDCTPKGPYYFDGSGWVDFAGTIWFCGAPLAITHSGGDVAPETKTINYGTIITNLTGTDKCWITQNLGAGHQATSATDATDASAGWYWQFNRKQGYMVGPTPAWTITSINETSDWVAAQDPCTIELGTGWRIPTKTEWTNADATGGWNNYTDTYNSVLKLHAAGFLNDSNGTLGGRGTDGYYWSSTQNNIYESWYLAFGSSYSYITHAYKAYGFSVRCLRD